MGRSRDFLRHLKRARLLAELRALQRKAERWGEMLRAADLARLANRWEAGDGPDQLRYHGRTGGGE